jgi:L-lactate utilization protein LutB
MQQGKEEAARSLKPEEQRNERLAATLIKQLNRRHMEAYYCATAAEAVSQVSALIADGSSVTWGGTMTVRDLGIPEALRSRGTLQVLDRDLAVTPEEKQDIYLRAFTADVYLTSANAISEDGVIVNIDGNGNRVAAITWGPKKVIFVIGLNKVAQNVEAALARARSTASPVNAARFDIKTPCRTDGVCHNCNSPESICSYVHFLRNSPRSRHVVVLVGETLGY